MGALWTLAALWLAQAALATALVWQQLRVTRRPQPQPVNHPPVLVLAPVRGPLLPGFLPALAAQDYPDWRVVFALEDDADPAHDSIAAFCAEDPARRALVLAGPARGRSQKVHNLLAALAARGGQEAALVTLDADTLPPPGCLRALLRPLLVGQAEISSGYRWLDPQGARPGAWLAALVDIGVATLPRTGRLSIAWGGATAISAAALARLDLPRAWASTVSDDGALTLAADRAGLRIYAPPEVRLPTPVDWSLPGAVGFGRRQLRLVWVLAPGFWALAAPVWLLPVAGALACLHLGAAAVPMAAAVWALLALRLWLRARIAQLVLPPAHAARARLVLRAGLLLAPVAAALSAACLVSSPGARLDWAGRRYWLARGGRVVRLAVAPRRVG